MFATRSHLAIPENLPFEELLSLLSEAVGQFFSPFGGVCIGFGLSACFSSDSSSGGTPHHPVRGNW
jgi:hypothetical protein